MAEKDPVPGEPEDIRDEVTRMKKLASTLRDQAAILRKAADGDALQGQYADKIREDSGDVEKHFRETAARGQEGRPQQGTGGIRPRQSPGPVPEAARPGALRA
ncbi:hypothetical protein ACFYWD_10080 [Streptomyces sp. NPDC003781]|uniref:hypothetical protein n=1 Tax=Streptomyces sp. NPDC003781 TaxID=3364686 RepID=UPI0036B9DBBB